MTAEGPGGTGPVQAWAGAQAARRIPPPMPAGFWIGLAAVAALAAWTAWLRGRAAGTDGQAPPGRGRIGPYQLIRPLGRGAFATTFLARHHSTGRRVALKVLHPRHRQDPDLCWLLHQEAGLGRRLDHPGVAAVVDRDRDPEPGWVALDYVAGPTLEQVLAARGRLRPGRAAAVALDLARALAHAHAQGVVHRDLKPGNVILGRRGATLTDLGAAWAAEHPDPPGGAGFHGTPAYAPPEAWEPGGAGPAGDRYSLGVVLFEMLAGRIPFPGPTARGFQAQHRDAPVPDLGGLAGTPPELARLVERLLAKDPGRRPGDAELVAALEALGGSGR